MESNFNRPGVDESRLQEFNQVLQKYKAGKRDIEERAKAAEEWWKLHNHSEFEILYILQKLLLLHI